MDLMQRRLVVIFETIVVLTVAILFLAPIDASVGPNGCMGCFVHYQRSLSCQFAGIGVSYWQGQLYPGCVGPPIP